MKKIIFLLTFLLVSTFMLGQEIQDSDFAAVENPQDPGKVPSSCRGGRGYSKVGVSNSRVYDVPADGSWYRCGSGLTVVSDQVGFIADKSTGLRQTVTGLTAQKYRITLKLKNLTGSIANSKAITISMKNIHDLNLAGLNGFSEASEVTYSSDFKVYQNKVEIKPGAYGASGYTTFQFDYTPENASQVRLYVPGIEVIGNDSATNDPAQTSSYIAGQDPDVGTSFLQSSSVLQIQKGKETTGDQLVYIDDVTMTAYATWTGATDTDWATQGNWNLVEVPTVLSNVHIPSGLTNYPTAAGAVAVNSLTIDSGASFIANSTVAGNVSYNRNLSFTSGKLKGWHLVGSPVVGQAYDDAYATTNSIATSGTKRGIATYNNGSATSNWSYLEDDDSNSGTFDTATGYSVKTSVTADVSFTGTVNTADVVKAITIGAGTPFNLISNPFTSYINSTNFLTDNSVNLTNQTIWVWNPTDENYDTKVTSDSFKVAPGQGFFVSCGTAGNVTFAETNQYHQGTDTFLKSGAKPEITLNITDGDLGRYAKIYFNNNATEGFDNGYDGETFTGVANAFDVFTQLVSNNVGKNYQIQSLPNTDLESMIVPVGVKAVAGKEITFTAAALNLPAGLKVFLEDRATGTFTRLDEANSNYKVTLTEALNGVGRFYLRATSSALSVDSVALNGVSIFKSNNSTLKIAGLTQGKAAISLFNILGKQVMSSSFEANGVKEILLPKLATGVYVVQLTTEAGKLSKKIILE